MEKQESCIEWRGIFEVLHDEKSPFLVDAGMYTVKVLGTKFNVEAYPGDICSYTSLKEGKVQFWRTKRRMNIFYQN